MEKSYYFCGVKFSERYEAAAQKQRFLYPYIVYNPAADRSVVAVMPTRFRSEYLTAPIAAFIMSN